MREIVDEGAAPRPREIGGHREVRREEQRGEGDPGGAETGIGRERCGEDRQALEPQQGGDAAGDRPPRRIGARLGRRSERGEWGEGVHRKLLGGSRRHP